MQVNRLRRRAFITLLGGAAAWPLAARAQQHEQMRRVGVLISSTGNDPQGRRQIAAFQQGLQELGWMEGQNTCASGRQCDRFYPDRIFDRRENVGSAPGPCSRRETGWGGPGP